MNATKEKEKPGLKELTEKLKYAKLEQMGLMNSTGQTGADKQVTTESSKK